MKFAGFEPRFTALEESTHTTDARFTALEESTHTTDEVQCTCILFININV
jgi:erythromycin esterase-like protein